MLIVTGAIVATPEGLGALRDAAVAHVHRSRAEPGCISHHVHADLDDPHRLFFFERWASRAALDAHAAHPDTRLLMAAVREHAASVEPLAIYEAAAVPVGR